MDMDEEEFAIQEQALQDFAAHLLNESIDTFQSIHASESGAADGGDRGKGVSHAEKHHAKRETASRARIREKKQEFMNFMIE